MEVKEKFMREAIRMARKAAKNGDYPIGSVIVKNNKIISKASTETINKKDATAHAEINAIRKACKKLNSRYLNGCILYATHEPCPMCTSSAIWAKMKGIVFGVSMKDALNHVKSKPSEKFTWRQIDITCKEVIEKGEPKLELVKGFLREECNELFDLSH